MKHVDHVCDISKRLPFATNSIDEILAESVLEHIYHGRFTGSQEDTISHANTILVLAEWRRVLKFGGRVVIKVPNMRALMLEYLKGNIDRRNFWMYIYGGQNYPENTHVSGFDPDTLIWVLMTAGFKDIVLRAPHNLNDALSPDSSWEMNGVGIK